MNPDFETIAESLLDRDPLPPLRAMQVYDHSLTGRIDALSIPALAKAGLHLLNDDLGHAHEIVQAMEGDPTADYWHAIVHRREGDFSNAGYWFRRVADHPGEHPVLKEVYEGDPAGPAGFVARCRIVDTGQDAGLEEIQIEEMERLLTYSAA